MNFLKAICLHKLQAVCLIPPNWKDVKGDLPANGVRQLKMDKLFLQDADKLLPAWEILGSGMRHSVQPAADPCNMQLLFIRRCRSSSHASKALKPV